MQANICFASTRPEVALKIAAEGALREVIGRTPIQAAMSDKRQQIADETRQLLQQLLDSEKAGIEITQVQLQRVDPPRGGDRRVQRRPARPRRPGARAQRGRSLRQRRSAARPRRGRTHAAGRRGLPHVGGHDSRGRRQRLISVPTPATRPRPKSRRGGSISRASTISCGNRPK